MYSADEGPESGEANATTSGDAFSAASRGGNENEPNFTDRKPKLFLLAPSWDTLVLR